ncbi:unnamed protein product, partial [Ectocarpus sp. 12 AP-2014]
SRSLASSNSTRPAGTPSTLMSKKARRRGRLLPLPPCCRSSAPASGAGGADGVSQSKGLGALALRKASGPMRWYRWYHPRPVDARVPPRTACREPWASTLVRSACIRLFVLLCIKTAPCS